MEIRSPFVFRKLTENDESAPTKVYSLRLSLHLEDLDTPARFRDAISILDDVLCCFLELFARGSRREEITLTVWMSTGLAMWRMETLPTPTSSVVVTVP